MSDRKISTSNVLRAEEIADSPQPYRLTLHPGLEPLEVIRMEKRRIEIKAKISREASRKIEESRERAREEIERAEYEAKEIVEAARVEAEAIVKSARDQEAAMAEEARKRGFAQARELARKEALEKLEVSLRVLESAAGDLKSLRREFLAEANKGMTDVVVAVTERLLKSAVAVDDGLVMRVIEEASGALSSADRIVLRIHPEDLLTVESRKDEIYAMIKGLVDVELVVDQGVSRGGALIESVYGRVDARMESRIAELARAIRIAARDFAVVDGPEATLPPAAPGSDGKA